MASTQQITKALSIGIKTAKGLAKMLKKG